MKGSKRPVWFTDEMVQLHDNLKDEMATSLKFPDFVRIAYHKEVDRIRAEQLARLTRGE